MIHSIKEEVLLAEDHPANQQIISHFLETAGYRVDIVENGALAVACFRERQYDLILMDVEMPVMGGHPAALAIRELERRIWGDSGHRVPIIALTALPVNGCKEECIVAGMDDCLCKPFSREELLHIVEKWLAPQRGKPPSTDDQTSDTHVDRQQGLQGLQEGAPMDFERAVEEFEGDRDCVLDVMNGFLLKLADQLKVIGEAIADGNSEAVRKESHSIRGCASNITAYPLAGVAGELDDIAASGVLDRGAEDALRRLQKEFIHLEGYFRETQERSRQKECP